jgi:hypothetical protein
MKGYCARLAIGATVLPYFELESFEGGGRYRLCVTPPRRRESCISERLSYESKASAWTVRVPFPKIRLSTNGTYRARWVDPKNGHRVGPKMHFISNPNKSEPIPGETGATAG